MTRALTLIAALAAGALLGAAATRRRPERCQRCFWGTFV